MIRPYKSEFDKYGQGLRRLNNFKQNQKDFNRFKKMLNGMGKDWAELDRLGKIGKALAELDKTRQN